MTQPTLLLMTGSLRGRSFNRKPVIAAARLFYGTPVMADLDLPLYNGDVEDRDGIPHKVRDLRDRIAAADAVAISTPKNNRSLSGVLKNALDWVSRAGDNPWADKPVALMAAAGGQAGGARAQYALRLALDPFQPRLLTGPEVMVARPEAEYDAEDQLTGEAYRKALATLMARQKAETTRQDRAAA
ncbi:NAD(P)H-dependent oxidoreductase [Fluviibacterium sp. DFM31]|uniref:NAD(P)H-dependent oxidoreductase n=1 Tax=Meridianimarinicoccus marinus TaxID=3231483 RepID=A0ABV3LBR9_9RHOB